MSGKILTYESYHYGVRVPIDKWEEEKITLPEGAGAKFIAPYNLTAIVKKPVFLRLASGVRKVYDYTWINSGTAHFPFDEELLEINEWLKRYGWSMPVSWKPIVESMANQLANEQGVSRDSILDKELSDALEKRLLITKAGYVWRGELKYVGEDGHFWSASEESEDGAFNLWFSSDYVYPEAWRYRLNANSVRCVAESGSFPNSWSQDV